MKLLLCPACRDVRKLPGPSASIDQDDKHCKCGKSWGYYTDNRNAVYGGEAIALGIHNSSLRTALTDQAIDGDLPSGKGRRFEAFLLPENCATVKRV